MAASARGGPAADRLRGQLHWFLLLRLLLVACFAVCAGLANLAVSSRRDGTSAAWIAGTLLAACGVTWISAWLRDRVRNVRAFAYAQLSFDVSVITALLLVTGGLDSPFALLYPAAIFAGAILLDTSGAAIASLLAGAMYTATAAALASGVGRGWLGPAPLPELGAQLAQRVLIYDAALFLIAYLSSILTTRLRDAERKLREQQTEHERLAKLQEALARHIGCGLVTTDMEGRITAANAQAAEILGTQTEELPGREIGDLFPPLRLTTEARRALLQSSPRASVIEFQHPSGGDERTLRCSAALVENTYGHPIGILYILQDVTPLRRLEQQCARLSEPVEPAAALADSEDDESPPLDGFVGRSPAISQVRALIEKVASSDATVLLCGESGTGKEVAARAIHAKSPRRDRPFIAINCGAIPENLIESELFGHVKGAFTGALANRAGCFRAANGGTVFLDEIGELPLAMQVKLLRVLQERVFLPVGSETQVAVDVRVIAASNKDLAAELQAGRFREDLFYRLNVISITLPPLRERPMDIPLLIRHFLRQSSELHRKKVSRLSVPAARRLLAYPYPGNVRELANIIEHAVTLCDGETVHESHLPPHVLRGTPPLSRTAPRVVEPPFPWKANGNGAGNLDTYLEEHEKTILLRALQEAGGVKKKAAKILGINYRSLRHRLSKYGLVDHSTSPQ